MKYSVLLLFLGSFFLSANAQTLICTSRNSIQQEDGETTLEIKDSPFKRPLKNGNPLFYRKVRQSRWLHKFRLVKPAEIIYADCELPYSVTYRDDFDGTELDTSYWSPFYPYCSIYDSIHTTNATSVQRRENVQLKDGELVLSVKKMNQPVTYQIPVADDETVSSTRNWSAGMVHLKQTTPCSMGAQDYNYKTGRFTARIKQPAPINAMGAYWFYGWAGEFDVFEVWKPRNQNPNALFTSFHTTSLVNWFNSRVGRSPTYSLTTNIDDMTNYHTYVFDWQNHKMTAYFDDEPVFELYRYYKIEPGSKRKSFCLLPLECADLLDPPAEVWEHFLWDKLKHHGMAPILSISAVQEPQSDSLMHQEMYVDYFQVEQKVHPDLNTLRLRKQIRLEDEHLMLKLHPSYLETAVERIVWKVDGRPTDNQEWLQEIPSAPFREITVDIFLKNDKNRYLPDRVLSYKYGQDDVLDE